MSARRWHQRCRRRAEIRHVPPTARRPSYLSPASMRKGDDRPLGTVRAGRPATSFVPRTLDIPGRPGKKRIRSAMRKDFAAPVLIFDVEGTLVDCVAQTLESWRETLADFGLRFSLEQLHGYSGMDGGEMLDSLLAGSKAIDL